jgi:DNA-binding NarL/FixJ family response regulator
MKILLADDHMIFREALKALLEKDNSLTVVAEVDDGRMAVIMAREFRPDIVIMDVAMPDMNGIEATRCIVKENPSTRIIALSMYSDKHLVLKMIGAGAKAYLQKDCGSEELLKALTVVHDNKI